MLRLAIGLLIVAIIAAIFGFGGIASTATEFAKIVFVIALVLAVVSFLLGGRGGGVIPLLVIGTTFALTGRAYAQDTRESPEVVIHTEPVRAGATFGGGVGLGHIACDGADCTGVNEAGGIDFHVGGMLAPEGALLLDVWGMSHRDADNATFMQGIASVALRYWMTPRLWLQGGVGVAQASWRYSTDLVDFENRSETVPALTGGLGLELIHTTAFALDLNARAGTGFFEDDVRVRNFSIGVGVSWY